MVTALPPTSDGEDAAGPPDRRGHRPFCSSRRGAYRLPGVTNRGPGLAPARSVVLLPVTRCELADIAVVECAVQGCRERLSFWAAWAGEAIPGPAVHLAPASEALAQRFLRLGCTAVPRKTSLPGKQNGAICKLSLRNLGR